MDPSFHHQYIFKLTNNRSLIYFFELAILNLDTCNMQTIKNMECNSPT